MNKRVYSRDKIIYTINPAEEEEDLVKRRKKDSYDMFRDFHPSVISPLTPTEQYCRHCDEPVADHHYYTYENYWNTWETVALLRCDRKIMRSYFQVFKMTDAMGNAYDYERLTHSCTIDVYELNEGRKTQ